LAGLSKKKSRSAHAGESITIRRFLVFKRGSGETFFGAFSGLVILAARQLIAIQLFDAMCVEA